MKSKNNYIKYLCTVIFFWVAEDIYLLSNSGGKYKIEIYPAQ